MKVLLALSILYAVAVLLTACHDTAEPIRFVNETNEALTFYVGSSRWAGLEGEKPLGRRSSLRHSIFTNGPYSWMRVAAAREDGQWVFDRTYSTDEWEKAGHTVVVSSLTPVAPPSDVWVIPYPGTPDPVLPSGLLWPPRPTPGR